MVFIHDLSDINILYNKYVKNPFRSPVLDKSLVKGGRVILELPLWYEGFRGGEWKTSAVIPAID